MINHKKYRQVILKAFSEYLSGEKTKLELVEVLYTVSGMLRRGYTTSKSLWFKFFKGGTLATDLHDIVVINGKTELARLKENMQLAIDNPLGFQIYFS